MKKLTEEDFWVEMSIYEIINQAHFAEMSFKNINIKTVQNNDIIFSSIHSFLSHCVIVSKLLKANRSGNNVKKIGDILKITNESIIHKRSFRNNLEHYDEELKAWIKRFGTEVSIGHNNIGPKTQINIPGFLFITHFDPNDYTFTFVNEEFNIKNLHDEVLKIKKTALTWVDQVNKGSIKAPYFNI